MDRRYNITVTDERLTQVIYTRGKGKHKRWGWSGFSIQSTDGGQRFRLPEQK